MPVNPMIVEIFSVQTLRAKVGVALMPSTLMVGLCGLRALVE